MPTTFSVVPSPVGELLVTASDAGLTRIYFPSHDRASRTAVQVGRRIPGLGARAHCSPRPANS